VPSSRTRLSRGVLELDLTAPELADAVVVEVSIDVIPPDGRDLTCDSILDVAPLATKTAGAIGSGTTRVAIGLVLLITAREEAGRQAGEFGDSSGILSQRLDNAAAEPRLSQIGSSASP
jgi:D-proline reductase (dithiol) PrdA